jgi:hypothetical protein
MADLALLVPSRGRPRNIRRLVAVMRETCVADTSLTVGVDADDPALDEYLADWRHAPTFPYELVIRDGLHKVVAWINELASLERSAPFLGHVNDDNLPRTTGWDSEVIASLRRQGTGFCFGNDLHPGRLAGSLACHIFMTRNIADALGYMACPWVQHMYVDDAWTAWGHATSIEFLPDVVIEHLHWTAEKAERDESYDSSHALMDADRVRYEQYCNSGELARDIRRIEALRAAADERQP